MLYICVLFDLQNHQQYLSMHVLVFRRELEEEEEEETPLPPPLPNDDDGATTCFPNNDAVLLIHDIDMGWPQNNY